MNVVMVCFTLTMYACLGPDWNVSCFKEWICSEIIFYYYSSVQKKNFFFFFFFFFFFLLAPCIPWPFYHNQIMLEVLAAMQGGALYSAVLCMYIVHMQICAWLIPWMSAQ